MADITVRDWEGTTTAAETGTDPDAKLNLIITMLRQQGATQADLVTLIGGVSVPSDASKASYVFKIAPEVMFAAATAAGAVLLQSLADTANITNYRTWIIGVAIGVIRAVIGALLALSKPKTEAKP